MVDARAEAGAASSRHRLGVSFLTLLALVLVTASAAAAWGTNASGPAATRARALSTSAPPTAVFARPKVTVSWSASSFSGGGAAPAYVVRRYNVVTGVSQAGSNSCSGLVTALTCTENNAPAGTFRYTVTSAVGAWRGIESPQSAPVVVT
jgi:hypothetical protein